MSRAITRDMQISIEPTPEDLAEVFWSMGSDQQAKFFNHLNEISGTRLCFQLQAVSDDSNLNDHGRYAMRLIGEYSEAQS